MVRHTGIIDFVSMTADIFSDILQVPHCGCQRIVTCVDQRSFACAGKIQPCIPNLPPKNRPCRQRIACQLEPVPGGFFLRLIRFQMIRLIIDDTQRSIRIEQNPVHLSG